MFLAGSAAPALAVQPPQVIIGALPADDPPGPEAPTKQDKGCLAVGVLPNSDLTQTPQPERALDLQRARSLSRGGGVTVAVIDTGVSPNPRLPNLSGAGDYVQTGGDGLSDCDAHGTLIAGIIGAAPDPADGFAGVAPDAHIISLRSRSGAFSPAQGGASVDQGQQAALDVRTLARAITHAANLGAQVITISMPSCLPADLGVDQSVLSAAIGYAVHVRGALIVAGAGDTSASGCEQNPEIDPGRPTDPRNWDNVKTISIPGWFGDVLTVGYTTATGDPISESLTGPWVSIAAPGTGVESLGPGGGGLINAVGEPGKLTAVGGASFAAAYVSGVAALVRSRYPDETPGEIAARLAAGAHAPARGIDNAVGAGMIDPAASLSFRTPPQPPAGVFRGAPLPVPVPPRAKDSRPGRVAAYLVAGALLLGVAVRVVPTVTRQRR
ncbi:type VII secretion-associated serine protease mycosin [Nocardia sp. NBC_00511]|uniref:type VII secretion-associated serine protease mycosin n=1 Tax=Nocardia sp. NBC_00511 TaxID=2903591 RepID=UPI0030E009A8